MKILALEPYYGGSHRDFLDGWIERSQHTWQLMTLPDHHWKWRMRHAAITFAGQLRDQDTAVDVVFASDMLDVAAFRSLALGTVGTLPLVLYFHENQLTYPDERRRDADYHFAFTNLTSALAADAVWFNSNYHRTQFLDGMRDFLSRMPDYAPVDAVDLVKAKSCVHSPGVAQCPVRGPRRPGPLRILWSARWEADKNPETFFEALSVLAARGVEFELSVVGGACGPTTPAVFAAAREELRPCITQWGYVEDRSGYESVLQEADVVVSTAIHEFFGIAIAEAVAAGAFPVVPDRLAYPELLQDVGDAARERFFYDGSTAQLVERLEDAADRVKQGDLWQGAPDAGVQAIRRFDWNQTALALDECVCSSTKMIGSKIETR